MKAPHILIADDHYIARLGIMLLTQKVFLGATCVQAASYRDVLEWVDKAVFDLIVLDVNMPNGSFQATLDVIKRKQLDAKILVFSSLDEELYAARYLKAGADGFVQKHAGEAVIITALERVMREGSFLSDTVKNNLINLTINRRNVPSNPLETLSDRELEVARMLLLGNSLTSIAHELSVHVATISTYKIRIFKKLGVSSVVELGEVFRIHHD